MNTRRKLLALAALGAATFPMPFTARAQRKTPVIGLLWNDSIKPSPRIAVFVNAMRDRGYVLNRDFRVEDRVTLEGYGGYAESMAELLRAKVNVIVTSGTTATVAAAKATKDIPIVATMGVDPVAHGLAASLSRPGGNVTGIATLGLDLTQKRIAAIKELVPGLSKLGVVLAPNIANPVAIRESETAGKALNLQLHFVEVAEASDIEARIAELAKAQVGAVYVAPSTFLSSHNQRVVAAIEKKHRLPAIYGNDRYADAGALMVYSTSVRKGLVRMVGYVDRILKGARAGDLPIEQTTDFEIIINLKAASALGITVPQSLRLRADRVIE